MYAMSCSTALISTWMFLAVTPYSAVRPVFEPSPGAAKRVACVGDSITFGFRGWAPPSTHAWPTMIQALLGKEVNVTNLGNSGKTMQKHGQDKWSPEKMVDSSWWNTYEFKQLVWGEWESVVIALGTNDAKSEKTGGPPNWKYDLCNVELESALKSCPYAIDYADLIHVARRQRNASGQSPDIYLVIPPPIMKQGAYNIDQTVVNYVLPRLIRAIGKSNGIPEHRIIDAFTLLGGRSWLDVPSNGCAANMTNVSGCSLFCDEAWCDQVHPSDAGLQAIGTAVTSSLVLSQTL